MAAKDSALIQLVADAAKRFVDKFYPALNADRTTLASYYLPTAAIVWNGNTLTGGDAFSAFFESMPSTVYDVHSYDAQPVTAEASAACSFLLNVSGSVKIGDSKELRGFSETFVLKSDATQPNKFMITTQGFRLVA